MPIYTVKLAPQQRGGRQPSGGSGVLPEGGGLAVGLGEDEQAAGQAGFFPGVVEADAVEVEHEEEAGLPGPHT